MFDQGRDFWRGGGGGADGSKESNAPGSEVVLLRARCTQQEQQLSQFRTLVKQHNGVLAEVFQSLQNTTSNISQLLSGGGGLGGEQSDAYKSVSSVLVQLVNTQRHIAGVLDKQATMFRPSGGEEDDGIEDAEGEDTFELAARGQQQRRSPQGAATGASRDKKDWDFDHQQQGTKNPLFTKQDLDRGGVSIPPQATTEAVQQAARDASKKIIEAAGKLVQLYVGQLKDRTVGILEGPTQAFQDFDEDTNEHTMAAFTSSYGIAKHAILQLFASGAGAAPSNGRRTTSDDGSSSSGPLMPFDGPATERVQALFERTIVDAVSNCIVVGPATATGAAVSGGAGAGLPPRPTSAASGGRANDPKPMETPMTPPSGHPQPQISFVLPENTNHRLSAVPQVAPGAPLMTPAQFQQQLLGRQQQQQGQPPNTARTDSFVDANGNLAQGGRPPPMQASSLTPQQQRAAILAAGGLRVMPGQQETPRVTTPGRHNAGAHDSSQVRSIMSGNSFAAPTAGRLGAAGPTQRSASAAVSGSPTPPTAPMGGAAAAGGGGGNGGDVSKLIMLKRGLQQLEMQMASIATAGGTGSEAKCYALSKKLQKIRADIMKEQREQQEVIQVRQEVEAQQRARHAMGGDRGRAEERLPPQQSFQQPPARAPSGPAGGAGYAQPTRAQGGAAGIGAGINSHQNMLYRGRPF